MRSIYVGQLVRTLAAPPPPCARTSIEKVWLVYGIVHTLEYITWNYD